MAESELFSFSTGRKKPSLKQLGGLDKPSSGALASKAHAVSSDSEGGSTSGGSGYSSDEDGTRRRRK